MGLGGKWLLTQVVHPLELLGDCHGASRLDCDYHPDCITKEVPSGLVIRVFLKNTFSKEN